MSESKLILADCLPELKKYPDNYFDLAIVDPPYYSGPEKRGYYGGSKNQRANKRVYKKTQSWGVPTDEYFNELIRVSKNQIVWGVNHYDYKFPGSGIIVWDKCNGSNSFSDCELAYCSMHNTVKMFRFLWNGMMQGKSISDGATPQGNQKLKEKRIHPTQKPVMLYLWLLQNYAKKGDLILDTHVGSGSSLIACEELGCTYVGYEKEPVYHELATKRIEYYKKQIKLW